MLPVTKCGTYRKEGLLVWGLHQEGPPEGIVTLKCSRQPDAIGLVGMEESHEASRRRSSSYKEGTTATGHGKEIWKAKEGSSSGQLPSPEGTKRR